MLEKAMKRLDLAQQPARKRGGRRIGAGAPLHNLNAFKSGRYSLQLRLLILALIASPIARALLLRLAKQSKKPPVNSFKK